MYEEKIAALGYEPVGLSTLGEIQRWLEASDQDPDLILLDLDLWPSPPDFEEIIGELSPVATLFMTNPERDGIDTRTLSGGPFLRKPFSANALASTLFTAIGSRSP